MRFEPSAEQARIRDRVRSLVREEIAPRAARIDEEGRYPRENLDRLGEQGLLGMLVPASCGGTGSGAVAYAMALSEVAGGCASTSLGMAVSNLVGEAVARYGNAEQKDRYLPPLASGALAGAFALTEPSAGSDARAIATTAVRDGNGYVMNGVKAFVTNGAIAGAAVVMAVTETAPRKRISAFLVDTESPGITAGKPERKMGLKGIGTVSLFFDDCRIPKRNLLGEEGEGFRIAMAALDGGRIGIAAQAIGIARAAIGAAAEFSRDCGRTGDQAVREMIADSATEMDAAELLALRAAFRKEAALPFTREASVAKVFASEAGYRACRRAVQALGEDGCLRKWPVERHLRDVKVASLYEGTSEVQRIVISRGLLGGNGR